MPPSNASAGADLKAFKLTQGERDKLAIMIAYYAIDIECGDYSRVINSIEEIINQGWQTCACDVDKAG